jgi:hypothetical protein
MNQQLELPLWETLQAAQRMPEHVNLEELLGQMEQVLAQVSEPERLRLAGDVLLRVAEVIAARSEVLITEWEDAYRDPVVAEGFFADVVRQTMTVDLSELMEPALPRKKRTPSTRPVDGSIVGTVDKAAVLAMVEQLEAEAVAEEVRVQQVLAIAHDENVSSWIAAIAAWLQGLSSDGVSFVELCSCLDMPWVEVWLGVLLGGFELEQHGEFYQAPIWIRDQDTEITI